MFTAHAVGSSIDLALPVLDPYTSATPPSGSNIVIDPSVTLQTMAGWEATAQAGQLDSPAWNNYKNALFDQAVDDLGLNRLRVEITSGVENPVDYFSQWRAGTITQSQYRARVYEIVNDNGDPNTASANGFQWSSFDHTIESVVLPMRQRLEARGEQLWVNVNYVDFGSSAFEHKSNPQEYAEFVLETYRHMQSTYGFVPDSWEVVLEADASTANWSAGQVAQAVKAAGDRLSANNFTPYFIAASTTNASNEPLYIDQIAQTPGAMQYIGEFSYHRYCCASETVLQQIADRASSHGKRTSMLEWIGADQNTIHQDLKLARNSSWQQYTLAGPVSWGPDSGDRYYLIDDTNVSNPVIAIGSRTKFLRQYFKFVRTGARRIEALSGDPNLDPLGFVNVDGKYVVVVKTTAGGTFNVHGLPGGTYGIKYTTPGQYDVDAPNISISAGQALPASIPSAGVITIYSINTATPSPTPSPSATPTTSPTPVSTPTPTPTATPASTPTPTPTPAPTPGTAVLTGSLSLTPPNVDLTQEGTTDWAHWGFTSNRSFDHKAGSGSQISTFTSLGNGGPQQCTAPPAYSWTDGTPSPAATGTTTCVYTMGTNSGFRITVPADTSRRRLKVYVGLAWAVGKIEARLSDGSSPAFIDTSLSDQTGDTDGVYTIDFSSQSDGRELTVDWTLQTSYHTWANVNLQSATLAIVSAPAPQNTAPAVDAGNDQIVTLPDRASLSAGATDDGLPDPPGSLSVSWSVVSGPGTVDFADPGSVTTTAGFSEAGQYTLRLTANDGVLASSDDVIVQVNSGSTAAIITGQVVNIPPSVNLSSEGPLDWAHWGLNSAASFDRKNSPQQWISNFTTIGGAAPQRCSVNRSYSWNDGTPTSSVTNTRTCVYIMGLNNGFRLTVPADGTQRRLKLYVGLAWAEGKLQATLSDGSAPVWTDTSIVSTSGSNNGIYLIDYRAAGPGQFLTVSWTVNRSYHNWNNVTLHSAAL